MAQRPSGRPGLHSIHTHVARGTVYTPYISLTRSYEVALGYAIGGRKKPNSLQPAFVYEIELTPEDGVMLIDPVKVVAAELPDPYAAFNYQHDGGEKFILGVASPARHQRDLSQHHVQPPPGGGTPRPPRLTIELETLVRALRDAEVLALGVIPASCVRNRFIIRSSRGRRY